MLRRPVAAAGLLFAVAAAASTCSAFAPPPQPKASFAGNTCRRPSSSTEPAAATALFQSYDPNQQQQQYGGASSAAVDLTPVQEFLRDEYPTFYRLLLSHNDAAWSALRSAASDAGGYTLFVPNEMAMMDLGDRKLDQLSDPRNGEVADNMGLYHIVNEPVSAEQLFDCGGIVTLGGEVPVGRSVTGGFFGIGGKEDGGVKVGGSSVVQSGQVGEATVHEVDGLISPELLWRYADQLRIPGSS